MKIVIKDSDRLRPIKIRFPMGLVLNGFTACFAPLALRKSEVRITRKQAVMLIRELKRCKKRFPDWKIVEVKSADGEYVEVKL